MKVNFCDFSNAEKKFIESVFNKVFNVKDFDRIFSSYEIFSKNFNNILPADKMETIKRDVVVPKTNQLDLLSKYQDLNYQVGIDLPVILSNSECMETVMIVAEDPLRRDNHSDVIIGIPFGIHIRENREKKLTVYWKVIENLLFARKTVYITDIYKLWIKGKASKEIFKGDMFSNFKDAMEYEIESIRPKLIIAFGGPANNALKLIGLDNLPMIASYPHPSRTANSAWKNILADSYSKSTKLCSDQNKISYLTNSITKYFA